MKLLPLTLAFAVALATTLTGATVVNDGTTVDGLLRRAPEPVFPPATTTLSTTGEGTLLAEVDQRSTLNFPVLHTAWYSEVYAATGVTHQASASFRPAAGLPADSGGGVLAWFNEATGLGVVFALKSAAAPHVGLEIYNLDTGARPREWLYDLSGVEVHPDFSEAWQSSVGANYRATNLLVLRLAFSAPSAEDLAALTNATARVTAEALQDNGQGLQSVAPRLEFLTTLPEPDSREKRFGYYAIYDATSAHTGPIGELDALSFEGEVGMGNRRPTVTLVEPVPGAVFPPGAPIGLVAEASDPDSGDSVARVDFFADGALIGSATAAEYSLDWTPPGLGTYQFTAVAVDQRGASRTSDAVTVTVADIITEPPTLEVRREGNQITLTWDGTGFRLEASADLGGSWQEVTTTGNQHSEAISGSRKLFRLVGSGAPAGPALTVSAAGGLLTITWTQAGYQLQSSADPVTAGWDTLTTQGNQHTEVISGPRKFFRLTR